MMKCKRRHLIEDAKKALAELECAVNAGFSITNWGEDNGCKTMLLTIREEATKQRALLNAAAALDREDPR